MQLEFLLSALSTLWEALKLLMELVLKVVESPVASIVTGAILAFGGRQIIYGVGLALIIYGVVSLLGIKLLP
jgi:hypothetical protein